MTVEATERIKVWHAEDGWRWQHWSGSDIIAESGEGYANKGYALEMADKQKGGNSDIRIILEGDEKIS